MTVNRGVGSMAVPLPKMYHMFGGDWSREGSSRKGTSTMCVCLCACVCGVPDYTPTRRRDVWYGSELSLK